MYKLDIRNFQNLEHVTLDIKGITLVVGASNSGKSAICRAVDTLLYGRAGEAYVRQGASYCSIALESDKFHIIRTKDAKGVIYFVDGVKYEKLGRKNHLELLEKFGIKEFTGANLSFRPNIARQFDPVFLVSFTPSEAFYFLSLALEDTKLNDVLKDAAVTIRDANQRLGVLEGLLVSVNEEVGNLTARAQNYKDVLGELTPVVELLVHDANLYEVASHRFSVLRDLQGKLAENERLLSSLELVKLPDLSDEVRRLEIARELYDEMINLEKDSKHYQQQLNLLESIKIDEKQYAEAVERVEIARHKQLDLLHHEQEIHRLDTQLSLNQSMLSEGEQELSQILSQLASCPYCSSVLTDKTKKYLLEHK